MSWNQLANQMFLAAIEYPTHDLQKAFVANSNASELEKQAVNELLAAHWELEQSEFLETPPLSKQSDETPLSESSPTHRNDNSQENVLMSGATFGRYWIERLIGKGGMGLVYLALDTKLQRQVAIKLPKRQNDVGLYARHQREARAMASTVHRNICTLYDVDEHDGIHFLSMQYVEGETLANYLRQGKRFDSRHAVELILKIARAAHQAHLAGVTHRDLKPANIMIDALHEPIIMDFGLAGVASEPTSISKCGSVYGTPAYMAPEQVRNDLSAVGPASDVYSLGAVFYELLTGRTIYLGNTANILRQLSMGERIPPVCEIQPNIDAHLESICMKALDRDVSRRYATASDFADALELYQSTSVNPVETPTLQFVTAGAKSSGRVYNRIAVWTLLSAMILGILFAASFIRITMPYDLPTRSNPWTAHWAEPQSLSPTINTEFAEENVAVSRDELTIFFNRAGLGRNSLWESHRTNVTDEFCEAALLPSNINRPDSTSDCPCLSKDKLTLWFSSDRTDGYGSHDLWFSHRDSLNSPWQDPINPGESVNSNAYEQSPFLSDDELTLLFSRAGENGVFQIYEARRTHREKPFSPAKLLSNVNDGVCSSFPVLTNDGLNMIFVHCRTQSDSLQLYVATRSHSDGDFGTPHALSNTINSLPAGGPSLSGDSKHLYFSRRQGRSADLWVAEHADPEEEASEANSPR